MQLTISHIFVTIIILIFNSIIIAQVNFTSSDLPIIIIETNGQEILDDPRIIANMKVLDNGEYRNYLSNAITESNVKISIEIRGSSSQSFPKKQYAFETQNNDGSNNNISLLGLPKENDWILSAPYSDKTLIRNILAYKLFENLGHYSPRTRLCEVVINNEYLGVYVLTEKIKRDNNRIDISALQSNDIIGDNLTGGYIVKIDKSTGNFCSAWNTATSNKYLQLEYPKCDAIAPEQEFYIKNYISNFEQALFSNNYADSIYGYQQYLDINSAIDYFIVNEITKNIDAYGLSTFLYKDKDSKGGKLNFGPVWDYNIAFGNADYRNGYKTNELIATNHIWWSKLLEDSTFSNKLKKRWSYIRENQFSNTKIITIIDSLSIVLEESQQRNFEKWDILNKEIWPNYYVGSSHKDEMFFLKSWVINRLNWLDNNMPGYQKEYIPTNDYNLCVFPNPFDYFFTFTFDLEKPGIVKVYLIDTNGKLLTTIINKTDYEKGKHKITWNSFINENRIANKIYILVLEVNDKIVVKEKIIKKI